jgi:hypothetical protein
LRGIGAKKLVNLVPETKKYKMDIFNAAKYSIQKYQREVACFYKEICNLLKLLQSKPTQNRQEATWLPALLVFLLSLSLSLAGSSLPVFSKERGSLSNGDIICCLPYTVELQTKWIPI